MIDTKTLNSLKKYLKTTTLDYHPFRHYYRRIKLNQHQNKQL